MDFRSIFNQALSDISDIAGCCITYQRKVGNAIQSVELKAVVGRTEHESIEGDNVSVGVRSRDYLFPACKLRLNDALTLPKVNDKIVEKIGDKTFSYAVLNISGNQCYSFSDPDNKRLRVHTKLESQT